MSTRLDLDFSALNREVDVAARKATRQLGDAIQEGFGDVAYAWPGVTKRRSGETAGTVRDVVDLGTLRDSQSAPLRVGNGHYELTWDTDYAAAVFLGAVFKRRSYTMPARNVPLNVLRDFDFPAAFAQAWAG